MPVIGPLSTRRTTRASATLLERTIYANRSLATKERVDQLGLPAQHALNRVLQRRDDRRIVRRARRVDDHEVAQVEADAVRAGRDAYVEKPMAHTMENARAIRQAVRDTGRIVQIPARDALEVEQMLASLRLYGSRIEDLEIGRADLEDVFLAIMQGKQEVAA